MGGRLGGCSKCELANSRLTYCLLPGRGMCSLLALLLQVSIPIARVDGAPVGLSLIGPPGSDEELLAAAVRLAGVVSGVQGE